MDLTHQLLLDLYGSVDDGARWTPMLDQLCHVVGVRSAVVQIFEHETGFTSAQWTARDTASLAQAAMHDRCVNRPDNPRLIFGPVALTGAEIGSDLRLFGPSHPMLGILRERLRQVDLGSAIWAALPIDHGRHFSLVLHRYSDDMRDLEDAEERFLDMLLPHLKQAVHLNREFARRATRSKGLETTLDKMRAGLVFCNAGLNVAWHNSAAATIIGTSSALNLASGRLWCGSQEANRRLRTLAGAVAQGRQPSATLALGDSSDDIVHMRIAPIEEVQADRAWCRSDAQIALFLSHSADVAHFEIADVAALFSLTPAEARLASAIASGETLADFAERRGIAVGTARIQLKQVLAKTASGRQAELVRKLCSSAAVAFNKA